MRRTLERLCNSYSETTAVATAAEAIKLIDDRLVAAIVDIVLPDASGIKVIEKIRDSMPHLPVLVFSGKLTDDVVNRTYELGAELVAKNGSYERLKSFLERALRAQDGEDERIVAACTDIARKWCLTVQQTRLLVLAAKGVRPGDIPAAMDISHNTFKTHERGLLRKSGSDNLAAATRKVFLHMKGV